MTFDAKKKNKLNETVKNKKSDCRHEFCGELQQLLRQGKDVQAQEEVSGRTMNKEKEKERSFFHSF